MDEHFKIVLHRLSGLLRTRVIMACLGLYVLNAQPTAGQWVAVIVGLSLGVSAIDALREVKNGKQ
jgi:hypothetical protein